MAVMKRGNERTSREQAKAYLTGQETVLEREEWERLLLEDEDTIAAYMEMLDEVESELPSLENSSAFVERVMEDWRTGNVADSARVEQVLIKEEGPRRYHWYEKTVFHYTVAASLTLLIMSSGMFDKLLDRKSTRLNSSHWE